MDLPACFSPVFLDFQFIDLSKMPSFPRKGAFHGYFVVSNPHKRLCILTCDLACHVEHGHSIEHTRMQGMSFLDDRWHIALLVQCE